MQTSNISWCDYSWNPVTGCTRYGPECALCYAESLRKQQAQQENPPVGATEQDWLPQHADEVVEMHPDRLGDPFEYAFPEGPGKVFVGSMTDMFHSEVDPWFVQLVLDACRQFLEHVWIFLTKRPHHAAEWRLDWPANCILGTSVGSGSGGEYPSTTHRIEQLRDVDVATKWVSFEPLIEPVGEVALDHIDWVVVGGESGPEPDRREMDHAWARDILRQCREADVPFYFKQSSGRYPETGTALTVEREYGDLTVYEQREIREWFELPEVTAEARRKMTA